MRTRTNARNITTTYNTNWVMEVAGISYSDGTPGVAFDYDRLGRKTNAVDAAGTHILEYDLAGALISESHAAGLLNGRTITNSFDSAHRRIAVGLTTSASSVSKYTYDSASRLNLATNGSSSLSAYSYVANSSAIAYITNCYYSNLAMTVSRQYDGLQRLTRISAASNALSFFSFNYGYNDANQRTAVTNKENARWMYGYDSLGQVTSGKKYWSDANPVAGQQFEYYFDHIGNRWSAAHGGNELGNNLRREYYSPDIMNQYSQRTVFGSVDILGSATNTATVTVNNRPTYRKGEYFRCEYLVTNTAALYLSLTNLGVLNNGTNADIVATNIGYAYIPLSPQVFQHDADGNLTNDGRFAYYWEQKTV